MAALGGPTGCCLLTHVGIRHLRGNAVIRPSQEERRSRHPRTPFRGSFRVADDTSSENRIVVTIALFDSAVLARIENMRLPRAAYQHWMAEAPRGGTVRVSLL